MYFTSVEIRHTSWRWRPPLVVAALRFKLYGFRFFFIFSRRALQCTSGHTIRFVRFVLMKKKKRGKKKRFNRTIKIAFGHEISVLFKKKKKSSPVNPERNREYTPATGFTYVNMFFWQYYYYYGIRRVLRGREKKAVFCASLSSIRFENTLLAVHCRDWNIYLRRLGTYDNTIIIIIITMCACVCYLWGEK